MTKSDSVSKSAPVSGPLSGLVGESRGLNEAVSVMRLLSNPQRLKIMCHLCTEGELCVGDLLERMDLSPSAMSQHLARLRSDGLVETRKYRQSVYYRVERQDVAKILWTLHSLYCGC